MLTDKFVNRHNGPRESGGRALASHLEKIHEWGNRLCRPAPLRKPQRHAPLNLGQISSTDLLPRPIADPTEIFLKRAES